MAKKISELDSLIPVSHAQQTFKGSGIQLKEYFEQGLLKSGLTYQTQHPENWRGSPLKQKLCSDMKILYSM